MAYKVFVGNLSTGTNGADLQEAFSHIGPIVNAYVVYQYGRSRRFGFVVFGNARSQQAAIEDMDGQLLDGWQIAVEMPRMNDWDSGPTWNTLEFDGASRGNPGHGGAGAVLFDPNHDVIDTRREYLGTDVTNNEAEYQALIMGLNMALEHDVDRLEICGDSEVVIRQLQGVYRVRSSRLHPLYCEARDLLTQFSDQPLLFTIPRGENTAADRLANEALDSSESDSRRRDSDDDSDDDW